MSDFYGALLQARDPDTGRGLTRDELIAESALLIIAGSDTMATGVTSAIFYLLHYPQTYERLKSEIWEKFEAVEDIIIGAKLTSCQYLLACIDESMRMTPGVGSVLQREVLPGGLHVDGEWFPPGTDLAVPHYALHHNEKYHFRPFDFLPERWLVSSERSEAEVAITRSAYCPYGIGRTSCVGKALSYTEMTLMLARIVWLYEMRLAPGNSLGEGDPAFGFARSKKNEFQTWDSFVSIHQGPMVQFRSRF
jgi:cytochrome P450